MGSLARHSPVFHDMFKIPQPPNTGEECPVVELWDSPHDLRHVLRLLMPAKTPSPFGVCAEHRTFAALAAWIRLGHKYEMHTLLTDALDYLRPYYPDKFDARVQAAAYAGVCAIGVVNLARLTSSHTLLPAALLACSRLSAEELADGLYYEDGSWECLSGNDMWLCCVKKEAIVADCMAASLVILDSATLPSHCKSPQKCTTNVQRALHDPNNIGLLTGRVGAENKAWWSFVNGLALCALCRRFVWDRYIEERRSFWHRLPILFGISVPGWDTGEETTAEEEDDA
ncbi:hypothetical protein OH76DRAFT_1409885 [Lentinus brumalis]|uniref:BTB domain-containing protein n=1 Tax=Lentinus brumalis TaxID=2498619 RepID=A0A371CTQ0_9APHY|nr:hypothetical protein OH76DRAFT_1409885 [Polyporus brumalis]